MNRNSTNQKPNPALKTKKEILQIDKRQWEQMANRAAISQKVATQQPKLN